jgi:hypothetical protein
VPRGLPPRPRPGFAPPRTILVLASHCRICARQLTQLESQRRGVGPDCYRNYGDRVVFAANPALTESSCSRARTGPVRGSRTPDAKGGWKAFGLRWPTGWTARPSSSTSTCCTSCSTAAVWPTDRCGAVPAWAGHEEAPAGGYGPRRGSPGETPAGNDPGRAPFMAGIGTRERDVEVHHVATLGEDHESAAHPSLRPRRHANTAPPGIRVLPVPTARCSSS